MQPRSPPRKDKAKKSLPYGRGKVTYLARLVASDLSMSCVGFEIRQRGGITGEHRRSFGDQDVFGLTKGLLYVSSHVDTPPFCLVSQLVEMVGLEEFLRQEIPTNGARWVVVDEYY